MSRTCYLPKSALFDLNMAAVHIREAFDGYPYLVGSALTKTDYRDVDVRVILHDDEYERLFPGSPLWPDVSPFWSLLCNAVGQWLGKITGLPIDFQIQQMTEANNTEPMAGRRHPLGMNPGRY